MSVVVVVGGAVGLGVLVAAVLVWAERRLARARRDFDAQDRKRVGL